jgi:hypothetical protein
MYVCGDLYVRSLWEARTTYEAYYTGRGAGEGAMSNARVGVCVVCVWGGGGEIEREGRERGREREATTRNHPAPYKEEETVSNQKLVTNGAVRKWDGKEVKSAHQNRKHIGEDGYTLPSPLPLPSCGDADVAGPGSIWDPDLGGDSVLTSLPPSLLSRR